ncbi:MAG: hypothetical protein KIS94_15090 [Chitinophagales bacterium]|nr:hypothetical protein [Chitinophagales bacterium]
MKTPKLIVLLTAVLSLCSFTIGNPEDLERNASFSATINGTPFKLRDDQLFRGVLVNRAGSMDGRVPARTVINTVFNGSSGTTSANALFSESIQFETGYAPDKTGEPAYYNISMFCQSKTYYVMKEQSKVTITHFTWETDRKHFLVSVEFDCKMKSYENAEKANEITLKGKMQNIRITVPGWLAAQN